jgi:hypothetical protein
MERLQNLLGCVPVNQRLTSDSENGYIFVLFLLIYSGGFGWDRTSDLGLRSPLLYPTELRSLDYTPSSRVIRFWQLSLPNLIITKNAFRRVCSDFLVHPTGFEPMTSRSASERSIQLSYGCLFDTYINTYRLYRKFGFFSSPRGIIMRLNPL